jgi:ABC-2 type transport system permease protein
VTYRPTIGVVNWIGLATLCEKEIRRFLKVWLQTILAPVMTGLVFLAIFSVAVRARTPELGGVPFLSFMAPGLIMMTIVQNAFANTSSSIMIAKVQGNIVDTLMPPLSTTELLIGYAVGGIARGLLVGLVLALAMLPAVHFELYAVGYMIFFTLGAALMLSLAGLLTAIWADKFDQLAGVTNFIITPLAFLSGTFYSIERLPEALRILCQINPIFYLIDGFRYGFTGHADGSLGIGVAVVAGLNLLLWLICWRVLHTGYKLKP